LDPAALIDIYESVRALETSHRPGIVVEAGCALGGSAIMLASAKDRTRPMYVYDTFEMIPPPSSHDDDDAHARYQEIINHKASGIRGSAYYGYERNLMHSVTEALQRYQLPLASASIHLVKGLFQDTLTGTEPVSLAHIDCDWYESVMTCLVNLAPRLVPNGELIIDDYDAWSGCRKAIDEYFAGRQAHFTRRYTTRLHIVRNGP